MVCLHIVPDIGESLDQQLERDSITIGRSSTVDLMLPDKFLSREHARLFKQGTEWWVEDLDSCNGTIVNGTPIKGPKRLSMGDELRLCRNTLTFQPLSAAAEEPSTVTGGAFGEVLYVAATELDRWQRPDSDRSSTSDIDLVRQAEMLQMLNKVHRALGSLTDLDELLTLLMERAFEVLSPDEALIFLRRAGGGY